MRLVPTDGDERHGLNPMFNPAIVKFHLDRDGQQVAMEPMVRGLNPTFVLPVQRAEYRLTASVPVFPTRTLMRASDTTWRFSSQRPTADALPAGVECYGRFAKVSTDACAAQPLLFLRYDLGLGVDNAVRTPGVHWYRISAYHNETPTAAPAVRKLTVAVSFDKERTWRTFNAMTVGGGDYLVPVVHPPAGRTAGTVSLRVHAEDRGGNQIDQTVHDAYRLK